MLPISPITSTAGARARGRAALPGLTVSPREAKSPALISSPVGRTRTKFTANGARLGAASGSTGAAMLGPDKPAGGRSARQWSNGGEIMQRVPSSSTSPVRSTMPVKAAAPTNPASP